MTPEKILDGIRELLYDLERAQNDEEFGDLLTKYERNYPQPSDRAWKKIDPYFKPAIEVEDRIRQWATRG